MTGIGLVCARAEFLAHRQPVRMAAHATAPPSPSWNTQMTGARGLLLRKDLTAAAWHDAQSQGMGHLPGTGIWQSMVRLLDALQPLLHAAAGGQLACHALALGNAAVQVLCKAVLHLRVAKQGPESALRSALRMVAIAWSMRHMDALVAAAHLSCTLLNHVSLPAWARSDLERTLGSTVVDCLTLDDLRSESLIERTMQALDLRCAQRPELHLMQHGPAADVPPLALAGSVARVVLEPTGTAAWGMCEAGIKLPRAYAVRETGARCGALSSFTIPWWMVQLPESPGRGMPRELQWLWQQRQADSSAEPAMAMAWKKVCADTAWHSVFRLARVGASLAWRATEHAVLMAVSGSLDTLDTVLHFPALHALCRAGSGPTPRSPDASPAKPAGEFVPSSSSHDSGSREPCTPAVIQHDNVGAPASHDPAPLSAKRPLQQLPTAQTEPPEQPSAGSSGAAQAEDGQASALQHTSVISIAIVPRSRETKPPSQGTDDELMVTAAAPAIPAASHAPATASAEVLPTPALPLAQAPDASQPQSSSTSAEHVPTPVIRQPAARPVHRDSVTKPAPGSKKAASPASASQAARWRARHGRAAAAAARAKLKQDASQRSSSSSSDSEVEASVPRSRARVRSARAALPAQRNRRAARSTCTSSADAAPSAQQHERSPTQSPAATEPDSVDIPVLSQARASAAVFGAEQPPRTSVVMRAARARARGLFKPSELDPAYLKPLHGACRALDADFSAVAAPSSGRSGSMPASRLLQGLVSQQSSAAVSDDEAVLPIRSASKPRRAGRAEPGETDGGQEPNAAPLALLQRLLQGAGMSDGDASDYDMSSDGDGDDDDLAVVRQLMQTLAAANSRQAFARKKSQLEVALAQAKQTIAAHVAASRQELRQLGASYTNEATELAKAVRNAGRAAQHLLRRAEREQSACTRRFVAAVQQVEAHSSSTMPTCTDTLARAWQRDMAAARSAVDAAHAKCRRAAAKRDRVVQGLHAVLQAAS